RLGLLKKGIDHVLENVLCPWPPVERIEVPKNTNEGGNDQRPVAATDGFENINAGHPVGGGVEVYDVVCPVPGNGLEKIIDEVPVGVDHCDSEVRLHVRDH